MLIDGQIYEVFSLVIGQTLPVAETLRWRDLAGGFVDDDDSVLLLAAVVDVRCLETGDSVLF